MKKIIEKELNSIDALYKSLNVVGEESDAFIEIETSIRHKVRKMMESDNLSLNSFDTDINIINQYATSDDDFDEKELKKMINFKAVASKINDNMSYDKFKTLVKSLGNPSD